VDSCQLSIALEWTWLTTLQFNCEMEPSESILAFRTITTMLNILEDDLNIGGKPPAYLRNTSHLDHSKARELQALNAIATLLVRQGEVTSVASASTRLGIDLVACATNMVCDQGDWLYIDTYIGAVE
jgi:hypothetical protein